MAIYKVKGKKGESWGMVYRKKYLRGIVISVKRSEMNNAQKIIIAIALILMSLISFNLALKCAYTIIALIVGFAFLGMAFFLLFRLKRI